MYMCVFCEWKLDNRNQFFFSLRLIFFNDWGNVGPVNTDNTCSFAVFIAVHYLFTKKWVLKFEYTNY